MSVTPIDESQLLEALRHVPAERWGEVLHFIDSLQGSHAQSLALPPIRTVAHLLESELVGMWAQRSDLGDSRQFARQLRQQAGHRGS